MATIRIATFNAEKIIIATAALLKGLEGRVGEAH